jgi:hypothetical protein
MGASYRVHFLTDGGAKRHEKTSGSGTTALLFAGEASWSGGKRLSYATVTAARAIPRKTPRLFSPAQAPTKGA